MPVGHQIEMRPSVAECKEWLLPRMCASDNPTVKQIGKCADALGDAECVDIGGSNQTLLVIEHPPACHL